MSQQYYLNDYFEVDYFTWLPYSALVCKLEINIASLAIRFDSCQLH